MYLFLKADATVSIIMIILYTYLASLTLFLSIYRLLAREQFAREQFV